MKENMNREQMKKANAQQFAKAIILTGLVGALITNPALAQSLKDSGVSVFNALYTIVGVAGAIGVLVTGVNWALGNPIGSHDPKKLFFQVLAGTAIAFGSVAIIQFIKDAVGGSGGGIGSW